MLRIAFTLLLGISLISCGSEQASKKEDSQKTSTEEKTQTAVKDEPAEKKADIAEEKELIEIEVVAKGEDMTAISFEPASLNIPAGSRVKLTFKNNSEAAGMYHNFVLVTLGKGQEVATAGIKAGKDNSFVPESQDVIFYTEVLDMGTSTVVEFDAPAKGSYHYICTYPGHYPNMIGRLNVQ